MIYDNLFFHTWFNENIFSLASLANPKAFLYIIFRQFELEFAQSELANG